MTPEEAACKIDHLYQPHGVVLDEDIIDILNQVASTAGNARLIEVAEKWEAAADKGEAEQDNFAMDPMTVDDLRGYAKALRSLTATPQGEKI